MAQYNIVRNSLFTSNTSDGIGTRSLNNLELASLINGNEADVAVVLNSSEVLCLDVDLVTRIKVSSILLYASDLTKLGNVDFYYKNDSVEDFTLCSKEVNAYAYSAQIPYPSAPSAIRCTVSGIDIDLYEFFIFNEDISVGFGYDGSESYKWLEDTPIGAESPVYEVEIFNNNTASDKSINAYVCVDYDGYNESQYLSIASSEEGPYSFVRDGVLFGLNGYSWDMGTRSNLTIDSTTNSLKLTDKGYIVTTYKNFLGILPNTFCNYRGIPFGVWHCWDYAEDRDKIYAFFYEGSTSNSGVLRLYEYTLATNIWVFLCNIFVTEESIYTSSISLAYNNGYIYFRFGSGNGRFFRHNLGGLAGNYTVLASYVGASVINSSLCSAGTYIIEYYQYAQNPPAANFYKYNITNNTWSTLAYPFISSIYTSQPVCLVYNPTQNCIYFFLTNVAFTSENNNYSFVSRYDIASNTWIREYFNYATRIATSNYYISMSYYNNRLFFVGKSLGSKCFVYNIVTDQVISFDLGCTFFNKNTVMCLATAPQNTLDDFSLYYVGVTSSSNFSEYGFYGHNTTFGTLETENILNPQVGTFTSTIFYLEDVYKASYLLTDTSSTPGNTSISKVGDAVENVIEIRSSNIAPNTVEEIFWPVMYDHINMYLTKYDINSDIFNERFVNSTNFRIYNICDTAVCRYTGYLAVLFNYTDYNSYTRIYFYNRNGTFLFYSVYGNFSTSGGKIFWAGDLVLWVVFPSSSTIYRYDRSNRYSPNLALENLSFYGFCADLVGGGAWYTDRAYQYLVALSPTGQNRFTITLTSVYEVCSTEDGGCWVIDNDDVTYGNTIKRFSYDGELISIVQTTRPFLYITHDHYGGFYTLASTSYGELRHYTINGTMDLCITNLNNYNDLKGGKFGVLLYSSSDRKVAYVSLSTKSIIWEKVRDSFFTSTDYSYRFTGPPDIFSWDIQSEISYKEQYQYTLLPTSYDSHWNTLEWQSIPKDGYFLPHNKYHQVRVTLRNLDAATTPELKSLVIAPVVKIEEIPVQKSKPVFVKTDLPVTNDGKQFNVKLRVWWGLEE